MTDEIDLENYREFRTYPLPDDRLRMAEKAIEHFDVERLEVFEIDPEDPDKTTEEDIRIPDAGEKYQTPDEIGYRTIDNGDQEITGEDIGLVDSGHECNHDHEHGDHDHNHQDRNENNEESYEMSYRTVDSLDEINNPGKIVMELDTENRDMCVEYLKTGTEMADTARIYVKQ